MECVDVDKAASLGLETDRRKDAGHEKAENACQSIVTKEARCIQSIRDAKQDLYREKASPRKRAKHSTATATSSS
jgi:hypothetical protein